MAVVAVLVLFVILWVWFGSEEGKARYKGKSIEYWFKQNLMASRGLHSSGDPQSRSRLAEGSLTAIKAMGTNAFPFLLSQAFATNQDSSLYTLLSKALGFLPPSWHRLTLFTQAEISDHAVDVICACKPATADVLAYLAGPLRGTNLESHLRARRILINAAGPSAESVSYLTRDLADPNPRISYEAGLFLGQDSAKAKLAFPAMMSYLKTVNPTQFQFSLVLRTISAVGEDAAEAVPCLEQVFNAATNWNIRCEVAETLAKVDVRETGRVLPSLTRGFAAETNWNLRLRLAETILHLDRSQTEPVAFLTNTWEKVTDISQRQAIFMTLAPILGADTPRWGVPLAVQRFRSPPFERWLELGKEVQTHAAGPTLEQWTTKAQGTQPEYRGRNLKRWLESAAPVPSPSDTLSNYVSLRESCEKAVHAIGTNAIPWLVTWLQSKNTIEEFVLARRGFGMLRSEAVIAVPALVEMTEASQPTLRGHAYSCLPDLRLDWTNIWPALIPVLHNTNPLVRLEAASYLYQNFPKEAEQAGLKDFASPWASPWVTQ